MSYLTDKIMAGWHNVIEPYPGRKLRGIVSVQKQGRKRCHHLYKQVAFHEEVTEDMFGPVRVSIRHYRCIKCKRTVFIYGPTDEHYIEKTLEKRKAV